MNKRGQIGDIVYYVGYAIAILVIGVVLYYLSSTMLTKTATAIAPLDNVSSQALTWGVTTFDRFWDYVLLAALFFNILILFISAFLIDLHPAFLILYIVGAFVLMLMVPSFTQMLDSFMNPSGAFSSAVVHLQGSSWFYNNFSFLILGIIFITGVILFAKYKLSGGQGGNPYR